MTQGYAWSPACRARCAQTKGPVSAHPYTSVRDVRRRARPSAHGITAAPASAFHVPMVSARMVLTCTYTYECWRAAAGIARRELLTCGTGPAASVCCQRWLGDLRSAVRWRRPGGPATSSPLNAAGHGARHDGLRERAARAKCQGGCQGGIACLSFVGGRGHGHQQSTV